MAHIKYEIVKQIDLLEKSLKGRTEPSTLE